MQFGLMMHYLQCCTYTFRYLNNPRDALKHFNAARRDLKWSSPAVLAMAEIYLNPDNDVSWASEGGEADAAPAAVDAETQDAIKAASTLLQQLKPAHMESSKFKVGTVPVAVDYHALNAV